MAKSTTTQDDSIVQIPRLDYEDFRSLVLALNAYAGSVCDRDPDSVPSRVIYRLTEQLSLMSEGMTLAPFRMADHTARV